MYFLEGANNPDVTTMSAIVRLEMTRLAATIIFIVRVLHNNTEVGVWTDLFDAGTEVWVPLRACRFGSNRRCEDASNLTVARVLNPYQVSCPQKSPTG